MIESDSAEVMESMGSMGADMSERDRKSQGLQEETEVDYSMRDLDESIRKFKNVSIFTPKVSRKFDFFTLNACDDQGHSRNPQIPNALQINKSIQS